MLTSMYVFFFFFGTLSFYLSLIMVLEAWNMPQFENGVNKQKGWISTDTSFMGFCTYVAMTSFIIPNSACAALFNWLPSLPLGAHFVQKSRVTPRSRRWGRKWCQKRHISLVHPLFLITNYRNKFYLLKAEDNQQLRQQEWWCSTWISLYMSYKLQSIELVHWRPDLKRKVESRAWAVG